MIGKPGDTLVEINWIVNPGRAEKFVQAWLPAAEAVLGYGATGWALIRSGEDPHHFVQLAAFANKMDFERYWYSEDVVDYRVQATGLFQVPIQPVWYTVQAAGALVAEGLEAQA
jgi:hypothetical protein